MDGDDLRAARQRIRDLIVPLRRRLSCYRIAEQLGHPPSRAEKNADDWVDDGLIVSVELRISAADGYPLHPYADEEIYSKFYECAPTRAEAIERMWQSVSKKAVHWFEMVAEDMAFSLTVGKQLRIVKEYMFRVPKKHYRDPSVWRKLPPGLCGRVLGHKPGYLIVDFGDPDSESVLFPTNAFRAYSYRSTTRVDDPYCVWVEESA